MKRSIRTHLRGNAVGYIALFVALGGSSYAAIRLPANSVGTRQLRRHSVTPRKVAPATVRLFRGQRGLRGITGEQGPAGARGATGAPGPIAGVVAGGALTGTFPNPGLRDGAVGTGTVADDALTGADVLESSLGKVPSASQADSATTAGSATTASNAQALGGIAPAGYVHTCSAGSVQGFVIVDGSATFSSTYTSDVSPSPNDITFNCNGQLAQARRVGQGDYRVRFTASGSQVAVGSVNADSAAGSGADDFVSIAPVNDGGQAFKVLVRDADGGAEDASFSLVAY